MKSIGYMVNEHRTILGMSRKELSQNICTEKYVYLIEKGERTPSADIIRQFSNKLGIDLFEYYEYLDCLNPKAVLDNIKCFNMYRRKNEMITLKMVSDKAMELPDFNNKPWIYEIEVNNFSYDIFVKNEYKESIDKIKKVLSEIETKHINNVSCANFYVLLSTCYQLGGDLDNAKESIMSGYDLVRNIHGIRRYEQIVTAVDLSVITMHYLSHDYEQTIVYGNELLNYQNEINSYERIHLTYFYLAFAYFKKGLYEKSFELFKKGVYIAMAGYKPNDIYYVSMQDVFYEMLNHDNINSMLAMAFKQKYKSVLI